MIVNLLAKHVDDLCFCHCGDLRLRRHVNAVSSSELMDAWQDKEKRHLTLF